MNDTRDPKYNIHIHGPAQGLTIGDKARVKQHFTADPQKLAAALDTPQAQEARARYLAALRKRYGIVQPRAFQALAKDSRVGKIRRLNLLGDDGIYVPLTFDAALSRRKLWEADAKDPRELARRAKAEQKPLTLPDILQQKGHLAIIGDAGSGKTTILQVIATALACREPAQLPADLRQSLPTPAPLPILLPLRFFDYACNQGEYQRAAADLLRFVDDWFARWESNAGLPPAFLANHIRAGRAWFLLDALDEVADPDHRKTARNIIESLAENVTGGRLIVSARIAGYRGAELNEHFNVAQVQDLNNTQRRAMINVVYRGLDLPDKDRRAQNLARRFQENDALQELGRTPVMVWTAAVIDALRGDLPESRAALYAEYVDMLLRHSFKEHEYNVAALDAVRGGSQWPVEDRHEHLNYLAFAIHQRLEGQQTKKRKQIVVDEGELIDDILAPYFIKRELVDRAPGHKRRAKQLAQDFVTVMVEHSGILYESQPGSYSVGDHLTMQEFLAARYLNDFKDEDLNAYREFLARNIGNSWWREVFVLATGFLAESSPLRAQRFVKQLAAEGETPAEKLAALALAARALLSLRRKRQRPIWYNVQAGQLADQLYAKLYAQTTAAPLALRQDAALALGLLHGYPNNDGVPDPRFPHPLGLPDFVEIEGGAFWMGSSEDEVARLIEKTGEEYWKDELPRHRVYLDPFELAKYPVTNAMFARFIDDKGYQNERWWTEAIADKRWADGQIKDYWGKRSQPEYWNNPRFNNPHQPVVGVTWYEAAAYCRWLTAALNDAYTYHLPTEAQWERAARGKLPSPVDGGGAGGGGRRYPWGDDWRKDRANSEEAGLETTSPVGLFPKGAAEGGLHDMAGNVYEWCADWYGEDYYARSKEARNPAGPEKGEYRVLRGGSWITAPDNCRCGFRSWDYPNYWGYDGGFRCARTLSS